ncbi:galactonate dehydratase [Candidatus Epulonipiscium viviparus]|uniref:galactonate dehydratase n=1 Tax=Candidatus Epulonipiscium viviparus TaxID=420336 RepID=UPI00016C09F5|nr:galactonate dehydratase [Candidatus Epulopiscium viviparus]
MKIINLEVFYIKPRWMLVKISTDEGIVGWGEPTLEGRATVVGEAIRVFKEYLLGEDPMNIEHLYNVMYRRGFYRGGAVICSAISGIEQALWDIKGKFLGVPVWQLLGGRCRDKIRMYAHLLPNIDHPQKDQIDQWVARRKEQGFKSVKMGMFVPVRHIDSMKMVKDYIRTFSYVREVAGDDLDIAIDFHGRISPAMAPVLCRELEPFHPMFIEEPVLPENVDALVKVADKTTIPIAAGERIFTTFGFRELIEKQAINIVQPDLCHCGGILQTFKIAAMAANYYINVAPHNPLGPVALAASLQIDTCIENFTAQEHPTLPDKLDLGVGLFKEPFEINDGYIDVPTRPGLGFEIDEHLLQNHIYDGNWRNPTVCSQDDNSLGEW